MKLTWHVTKTHWRVERGYFKRPRRVAAWRAVSFFFFRHWRDWLS